MTDLMEEFAICDGLPKDSCHMQPWKIKGFELRPKLLPQDLPNLQKVRFISQIVKDSLSFGNGYS
jgi:hypothetical protein